MLLYALLGIVQGLTEFLPVSSSAHLLLAEHWLRFNPPGVLLEITVHMATLVAVVVVYRRDLLEIIRARDWRYLGLLAVATVITVVLILPFRDFFAALTEHEHIARIIGASLLITAIWLAIADRRLHRRPGKAEPSAGSAALMGLAQAIAAFPGISRSGATIGAGILLGIERAAAARFSFLMSIPVILGAGVLSIPDLAPALESRAVNGPGLALAFVTSLASGIAAIYLLLWMLRKARLLAFSIYCAILGLLALIVG